MTHRPYSLPAPGRPSSATAFPACVLIKRGRAERRGHNDPAASCECELDFTRVSHHGIAGSPASRTRCFRFAPLRPRWTAVSGALSYERCAFPPLQALTGFGFLLAGCLVTTSPTGPQRRTGRCAGTERLGPPVGFICVASPTPRRPPLPAPASDDADQTPLVDGTG